MARRIAAVGRVMVSERRSTSTGRQPTVWVVVDELLDIAVEAARRAGALLLDGRGHARSIETKSSATDMVSDMDRASEEMIRATITSRRPADAILGEEGGSSSGGSGVRWIVDPLDGTTNFLYGFPAWAVSVAAECDGDVVAGAVFDPNRDELWTATQGGGAYCNGQLLPPVVEAQLAEALVATGFSYSADDRAAQGAVIADLLPRVRDIRRAGAAALDLCWQAAGRVNAYFETGTHVWDWAGGALVARQAGSWVGDFEGGPPSEEGLLAAPPRLAEELRAVVRATGGARR
jgi:myo-inositol-1(or 4)-monophosphatase